MIDVVMSSDVEELQEVVVTALGITKEKAALGYAVTVSYTHLTLPTKRIV